MLYKCEPQTQILTAGHWSRQFVKFAVTAGAMPNNFDLKVSNKKARCHAIFSYNQEIKKKDIKYRFQPQRLSRSIMSSVGSGSSTVEFLIAF